MNRRSFVRSVGTVLVGIVALPKLEIPSLTELVEPVWNPIPDDITPYVWRTRPVYAMNRHARVETMSVTAVYRKVGSQHGSIAMWLGSMSWSALEQMRSGEVSGMYCKKEAAVLGSLARILRSSHRRGQLQTRLPVVEQKLDNGLYLGELATVQWVNIDYLRWVKVSEYASLREQIPFDVFGHPYGAREAIPLLEDGQ